MELNLLTRNGQQIAAAPPGQLVLRDASGVDGILEFCFAHRVRCVLLHFDNLADEFFDLRSGMAGAILQKCRTYRRRVAVVLSPDRELSSRFRELIAEENQGPHFRFFDDVKTAEDWLSA